MSKGDYQVVSAADAQKVIDSEPRFKEMRDALLPYMQPESTWSRSTSEFREFHAACALGKLISVTIAARIREKKA